MNYGAHFLDDLRTRNDFKYAAERLVGLSFGANEEAYEAALYPYDNEFNQTQMGSTQYGCGLTCEAILRACNVDENGLYLPYAGAFSVPHTRSTAISFQRQMAERHGAWVDTRHFVPGDRLPDAGDMPTIGGDTADGIGEYSGPHVYTHTDRNSTVEGGQPDPKTGHGTLILAKKRAYVVAGTELWSCAPGTALRADGRPTKGRRCQGFADCTKLRRRA